MQFVSDIRYVFRALWRRPIFTLAAIITLALGIGANSVVFSVVNTVLVRSLPYSEPERLAHIWQTHPTLGATQTTYPDFVDWRNAANSFDGMAAYTFDAMNRVTLTTDGEPEQVQGTMVSQNLFSLMGIQPLYGRLFEPTDEAKAERVVIISERLWQRRYGRDPSVVGRTIQIGPLSFVVIGVISDQQRFPTWADMWMPLSLLEPMLQQSRRFRPLEVVARLKSGATITQAQNDLSVIASNISQSHPDTNQNIGAQVIPLQEKLTAQARPGLLIIWLAAGIVLLIACSNIAHLFLVRTISRRKEVGTRLAVGARPRQIVRLLATEIAVVVFLGALLGTILAAFLLPMLRASSVALPRVDQVRLDPMVWLYTVAGVAIVSLIIFIPSFLEVRRSDLSQVIKQGDVHLFSNRGSRLGSILMASEVALGFMTLAMALLLVRSFASLVEINPGFNGKNVMAVNVLLSARGRGWGPNAQLLETKVLPEIANLPGVQSVASVNTAPMSLQRSQISRFSTKFGIPGANFAPDAYPVAQMRWISQDYFRVLNIPLLKGNLLQQSDRENPRYIINNTLANRFFPGQDPVGKQLLLNAGEAQQRPVEIVGVVGDVRDLGLDLEVQPTMYAIATPPEVTLLVSSADVNSPSLAAGIKDVIRRSDANAPITGFRTVEQGVSQSLARPRLALRFMVGFAILTALLLVVGVHGVIAYTVSRSTRDFGIRTALGAGPSQLVWLVLRKGFIVALIGLGVGLALSWFSSRLITGLLFHVSPTDPVTLVGAGALLLAICALSMLLPARRAASTDAAITLKSE